MNILITGATGVVGYDLLKFLSKNNKIFAFYRNKNNKVKKTKNISWIKINSLATYHFPKNLQIECIIHCAVDQKYLGVNKKKYLDLNQKIIKNLINYFKKNQKKIIFIHFSSIEIYGIIKKKVLNENYKPVNQNMYGLMKHKCEKILEKSNINYVNLRLPGILSHFSKEIKHRPWINLISHKFLKNKDVQIYNPKAKFNNLISTEELLKIIFKLMRLRNNVKKNFNVASSDPISLEMTTNIIKKRVKSNSSIIKNKTNKLSFLISKKKLEKFLNHKIGTTKYIVQRHLSNLINSKI
tara:strand:+ start:375 stop:1262 length:888 start_codon:yes stop_codon:yes gene_type:complete